MLVTSLYFLLVATVFTLWWSRQPLSGRTTHVGSCLALLLAAIWAAHPFLTDSGVGTGEAINYGRALKDAVEQIRAGNLPLVGQTESAFNGRIHPLRNAPYLFYFGAGLDIVTFRQLSHWQLQNLSAALSLTLAPWFVFIGLRRWCRLSSPHAAFAGVMVALSPAGLTVAHALNMFMTVHALPWAALATVALAGIAEEPRNRRLDWVFGASLALAWWAHPPLALWASLALVPLRLALLVTERPFLTSLGNVLAAVLYAGLMVAFVFASVGTSQTAVLAGLADDKQMAAFGNNVAEVIAGVGWKSLKPILQGGAQLETLQIGWVVLASAFATLAFGIVRLKTQRSRSAALGIALAAATLLYAALCLPLGALPQAFWSAIPGSFATLTNVWPMQRLFPLCVLFATVGAALLVPRSFQPPLPKWTAWLMGVALAWLAFQAAPQIGHGRQNRWGPALTEVHSAPANLSLSQMAYSGLEARPNWSDTVVAPWSLLRVVGPDGEEKLNAMDLALAAGKVVVEGPAKVAKSEGPTQTLDLSFRLERGKMYVAEFRQLHAMPSGVLLLSGTRLKRDVAFAVDSASAQTWTPDRPLRVTLEAAVPDGEKVQLLVSAVPWDKPIGPGAPVAQVRLLEVDPAKLPLRLESLMPLRIHVSNTIPGDLVVTPRAHLSGYRATANGFPAAIASTKDGMLAVALPGGAATVAVEYPGPKGLRPLLALSLGAIGVALVVGFARVWQVDGAAWNMLRFAPPLYLLAVTPVLILALLPEPRTPVVVPPGNGPLLIDFRTNQNQLGRSETVLSGGAAGAANLVFVKPTSDGKIEVGVESWGREPVRGSAPANPQGINRLVIDSTEFNKPSPEGTPVGPIPNLAEVELNGVRVLRDEGWVFPAPRGTLRLGRSDVGGSHSDAEFTGKIVSARRIHEQSLTSFGIGNAPKRLIVEVLEEGEPLAPLVNFLPSGGLLMLRREANGRATLVWRSDAGEIESKRFMMPRGVPRLLTVQPKGDRWTFNFDNLIVLEGEPGSWRRGTAWHAWLGKQANGEWPARALTVRVTEARQPKMEPIGGALAITLVPMSLPEASSMPLVSFGETGVADVVSVIRNGHTLHFTWDHWGQASKTSQAIPFDPADDLFVEVLSPALLAKQAGNTGPAAQVRVNGVTILRPDAAPHAVTADKVFPLENPMGASTAAPKFLGEARSVERLDWEPEVEAGK